ncbi:MAG: shikimate kinase [Flavobacteriales bacterium]|jgi:shikimate kinase|nr:shikimate kinase [Flavobacteriales bacterium]
MLYLIGFMGVGKTTIGKQIAAFNKVVFIDTDSQIEKETSKSIKEIFETDGEIAFRKLETDTIRSINRKAIIACGGGLPAHNNNIEYLKHKGTVIYLKASTETLIKRLEKNKNKRPLISKLTNDKLLEFIRKILKEREETYKQADYTIETDNKTVKEVLREINSLLLTI